MTVYAIHAIDTALVKVGYTNLSQPQSQGARNCTKACRMRGESAGPFSV